MRRIRAVKAEAKMADATNDAFRGMKGAEALFKSKAELKAEKEQKKAAKKLEKSKVGSSATPSASQQSTAAAAAVFPCMARMRLVVL